MLKREFFPPTSAPPITTSQNQVSSLFLDELDELPPPQEGHLEHVDSQAYNFGHHFEMLDTSFNVRILGRLIS